MQLTAKLTQILPIQTGTGKNREWKKQDIIVEADDQHNKKYCISITNDRINIDQFKIGNKLIIEFSIESIESKGRWFVVLHALKISDFEPSKPENKSWPCNGDPWNELPWTIR